LWQAREGETNVPVDVKPGDRVLFGTYSGTESIEAQEYSSFADAEFAKLKGAAKAQEGVSGSTSEGEGLACPV